MYAEISYYNDLRLIADIWQPEVHNSGIFPLPEETAMFANIKQLLFLSSELVEELKEQLKLPEEELRVSECFSKRLPFFRLYSGFYL